MYLIYRYHLFHYSTYTLLEGGLSILRVLLKLVGKELL